MNLCIYKPIIELKKIYFMTIISIYNSVISFEELNLYFYKSNDGMCKKFQEFNVPDI